MAKGKKGKTVAPMKKRLANSDESWSGFTIIEVVLVLAIAGLIFLMVFLALPALQRSQRDTQRRNDLSRVAAQVLEYQTNNGGKVPSADSSACTGSTLTGGTNSCDFIKNYLNSAVDTNAGKNLFVDPRGNEYNLYIATVDEANKLDYGTVYIVPAALCNGEMVDATGARPYDYAVMMALEGTGVACVDNHS